MKFTAGEDIDNAKVLSEDSLNKLCLSLKGVTNEKGERIGCIGNEIKKYIKERLKMEGK